MHCIEACERARVHAPAAPSSARLAALPTLVAAVLAAGCSSSPPPAAAPSRMAQAAPAAAAATAAPSALAPPQRVRNWAELRLQAAQRIVAANPGATYTGPAPEPLLAVPVLEIELNADGSIRRIEVLRVPRQAQDTVKLASDAVHRAAPFGDVSKLPRPWKFVETFLFDDDRRFKPRTLDQ